MTAPAADLDLHCEHCGYLLRGLLEPRCPECGQPVEWKRLTQIGSTDLSELSLAARATQLKLGFFWGVFSTFSLLLIGVSSMVLTAALGTGLSIVTAIPAIRRRALIQRIQQGISTRLQATGLMLGALLTFLVTYIAVVAILTGLILTLTAPRFR